MPQTFFTDDDKAPLCIPFILERLAAHQTAPRHHGPLIIGLNGMQGVGKTTLVAALAAALAAHGVHALFCSIDDFYLPHEDQVALARQHADNALLQHRGEPGTHDVPLAKSVFAALVQGRPTKLPRYDKGAFNGQGDRLPETAWTPVNQPRQPPLQVVILEGWSVGFRPISPHDVEAKWNAPSRTLHRHRLQHLLLVNEKLHDYDGLTDLFDAFIHIDSEDPEYVYAWRQQQEDCLRADRGDPDAGMTPEQVISFVDGYFPAYELYTDRVRKGVLADHPGCQLRMVVGRDRKVKQVIRM